MDKFDNYFRNLVSGASNVFGDKDKSTSGAPTANTAFFKATTPGEI